MSSDHRKDSLQTQGSLPGELEDDGDLDRAFDRMISADAGSDGSSVRALVPSEILKAGDGSLTELLASARAEYDEIEKVLDGLREHQTEPEAVLEDTLAVVSDDALADPESLTRALAPLQSKTAQIEFLYARAKYGLDRLDMYRLSRMSPERLIQVMRQGSNLRALQNLVQYLHALNAAADALEALSIPRPQIRDYLRHLYSLADWQEMFRIVKVLELAVGGVEDKARPVLADLAQKTG